MTVSLNIKNPWKLSTKFNTATWSLTIVLTCSTAIYEFAIIYLLKTNFVNTQNLLLFKSLLLFIFILYQLLSNSNSEWPIGYLLKLMISVTWTWKSYRSRKRRKGKKPAPKMPLNLRQFGKSKTNNIFWFKYIFSGSQVESDEEAEPKSKKARKPTAKKTTSKTVAKKSQPTKSSKQTLKKPTIGAEEQTEEDAECDDADSSISNNSNTDSSSDYEFGPAFWCWKSPQNVDQSWLWFRFFRKLQWHFK